MREDNAQPRLESCVFTWPLNFTVRCTSAAMNISANPHAPTNVLRRTCGIGLAFAPVAVLLTSVVVGLTQSHRAPFSGVGWMIPGLLIAVLNFYLSFIRPLVIASRQPGPYRHVSGAPVIGTILVTIGAVLTFGAVGSALLGLCAFATDTGGTGWFVVCTWRDRALWDA